MSNPVIDSYGNKRWCNSKGKLHRLGGPAIENADGHKEWWVDGKLHRLDGPAYEDCPWYKEWWVDGKPHRLDGPAVEGTDGYKEWWVDGLKITESEYQEAVRMYKINMVLEG